MVSSRSFLLPAGAVLLADQILKAVVLSYQHELPLKAGVFGIAYAENTGAAFGLFQGGNLLFVVLGVAVILLILKYRSRLENDAERLAVSLILGGAAGNVLDRIFRGHVIDYVGVAGIPSFNLADAALTAGAALAIAAYIQERFKRIKTKN